MQAKAGVRELQVLLLDTVNDTWAALKPAGSAPSARGGHSVRACCQQAVLVPPAAQIN
jgi:hypothetical protein